MSSFDSFTVSNKQHILQKQKTNCSNGCYPYRYRCFMISLPRPNFGIARPLRPKFDSCWFVHPRRCGITRRNCALDRRTILWLCVPGFQRQVFKHVKTLSERSMKMKEQRERPCCGIRLYFPKSTVWPRNGPRTAQPRKKLPFGPRKEKIGATSAT